MMDHPHPLLNGSLRPGWHVSTVNAIKSQERHSCVAGPFGSSISAKFFVEAGVPIIRGSNLSMGLERFISDTFAFISENTAAKFVAQTVRANDLVFTCWGTVGQVGIIPTDGPFDHYVISNKQLKLRVNVEMIDPLYAYYFFACPETVQYIRDRAIGSAVPGINLGILKALPVLVPPIDIQRRIAAILGTYDDLIEVNQRRVARLEGMARGLFEEWFVRFRFPGHEAVPMIDTPDGPVPKGWAWSSANQVLDFDPKTRILREGEKPFVSMGHLDTSTSVIAPHELREGNSGAKFQTGDVLFARITPCLENGKTGLVRDLPGGVGFGSTEFIVMRGARAGSAFAYCLARSERFRAHAISGMSGASGRQRARTDSVSAFTIATPPGSNLFDRFEAVSAPMLEAVGRYAKANVALAASRDLLLPRLISGQLSVAAAERELEAA